MDFVLFFLKVGAPPEIACLLEEIRREKDVSKHDDFSMCFGVDPELDEFMVSLFLSLSKTHSSLAFKNMSYFMLASGNLLTSLI